MAQLVARLVRNEKVGGSNPPSSTTGRHPVRMSVFCMPGRWCGAGLLCCSWRRWCSGRRRARPLYVPVGGGPPARSPHASLRLGVVDLEARPGPAATHRHRGQAIRRPPHRRQLVSRSQARPRRRPRAPQPGPATAHGHRGLALRSLRHPPHRRHLVCGCVDWLSIHLVCGTKFALHGLLVAKAVQSSPCTHETRQNGPFRASRASFIPHMQ